MCEFENFFEINFLTIDFTKKKIFWIIYLGAFGILFIIPNVKMKTFEETDGVTSKKLTMKDLMRVCTLDIFKNLKIRFVYFSNCEKKDSQFKK